MKIFCLLCVSLTIGLCSGDASRDLARLQRAFFDWRMSDRPLIATARDIHTYNDQLESYNMTIYATRKAKADTLYGELKAIPVSELTKADLVSYKILDDMLSTYIAGYKWRYYLNLNPFSFLGGDQRNPSALVRRLPFNTRGDFTNYISRLQKFPQKFSEYKAMMTEAIRLGHTNHNVSMNRVEAQFQALQVADPTHSAFYAAFNDTLTNATSISDTHKADLRLEARTAVANLLTAFDDLWTFIRDEYIPNTRPQIGVSSLTDGNEFYQACIRWYLSVDMTPQEIHDIGLREVERIVGNMRKIINKQGFNGTVREYFGMYMNRSDSFFDTADEILEDFRHMIFNIVGPVLDKLFINIPNLPLEVRPMATDGPLGGYSLGSPDGTRPGIFYANVMRPHQRPKLTMMSLALHEASPGHHMQLSYAITADTPDFRQKMEGTALYRIPFAFPRYTAFAEGWALYAEALGEELGLYRDDYELMGRYSSEMFRACRLVVDTGIHALNWTRQEAIDFFLNYTANAETSVALEIDRYITWPGQALSYKIGEIKIMELRRKAEQQLGDKFDIREFHQVVLESGSLPLSVLEELVDDWLDNFDMTTVPPVPTQTCAAGYMQIEYTALLFVFVSVTLMFNNII